MKNMNFCERLLRAVHLPELWNIAGDLKEILKSLLIEFRGDTKNWNMMNKKEDKLLTGNDLDSRVRGLQEKKTTTLCVLIQTRRKPGIQP